uniref:MULE transposase domain-containing protein n=1 Tax=Oryza glaberrima TaxID=4538 RepID=I1Q6G1_ORYGL
NEIIEGDDLPMRHIIKLMEKGEQYTISNHKAWRAKQKAMEKRYGTFEEAYDTLPQMLNILKSRNPRTYVAVQDRESIRPPNYLVMQRAFFAFGACIHVFQCSRQVLCVDGTFLTGKYRGQILIAVGADANNQIIQVGFAFVESENYESWLWFLQHLKWGVVQKRTSICIIHDRNADLLKAIKELQEDGDGAYYWPDMHSRWCMRHMGANFFKQFNSRRLMNMFKRLCKANQSTKFDELWKQLDEGTRTHIRSKQTNNNSQDVHVPQALEPIDDLIPSNGKKRRSSKNIKCFTHWIECEPNDKSALLHDTNGARHGIMTTNLAEAYNAVLRKLRPLPLIAIVKRHYAQDNDVDEDEAGRGVATNV